MRPTRLLDGHAVLRELRAGGWSLWLDVLGIEAFVVERCI
jgi:hypothetical protein